MSMHLICLVTAAASHCNSAVAPSMPWQPPSGALSPGQPQLAGRSCNIRQTTHPRPEDVMAWPPGQPQVAGRSYNSKTNTRPRSDLKSGRETEVGVDYSFCQPLGLPRRSGPHAIYIHQAQQHRMPAQACYDCRPRLCHRQRAQGKGPVSCACLASAP